MPQLDAIHFDVAALVVMLVTVASLYLRHMTRGATNRVYLTAMVLVLATVLARLGGELYSVLALPGIVQSGAATPDQPPLALDAFTLLYCALRSLTAPVFLVLIATVSGTTHLLNISPAVRIALWGPMLVVLALILTNPLHHLVYYYVGGAYESGMLAWTQQFVGLYYSITGIVWLVHWRQIFGTTEFYTLLAAYPIALCPILVQQLISTPNVNMFVTAVIMMLVSAFVIRPERRLDALVGAASFEAYQAKCNRAIITGKPLCLVYVEIVNLEKLRELTAFLRTVALGPVHVDGVADDHQFSLLFLGQRGDLFCHFRHPGLLDDGDRRRQELHGVTDRDAGAGVAVVHGKHDHKVFPFSEKGTANRHCCQRAAHFIQLLLTGSRPRP